MVPWTARSQVWYVLSTGCASWILHGSDLVADFGGAFRSRYPVARIISHDLPLSQQRARVIAPATPLRHVLMSAPNNRCSWPNFTQNLPAVRLLSYQLTTSISLFLTLLSFTSPQSPSFSHFSINSQSLHNPGEHLSTVPSPFPTHHPYQTMLKAQSLPISALLAPSLHVTTTTRPVR